MYKRIRVVISWVSLDRRIQTCFEVLYKDFVDREEINNLDVAILKNFPGETNMRHFYFL